MPKLKTKPAYASAPPIDWLWAAILERKIVFGWDLKRMADVGETSYTVMRRLIRMSPWDWPKHVRENICKAFGLDVKLSPECITVGEMRG